MHAMLSAEATPRAKPGRPRAGEVDVLIGKRVRERRLMLGITVQELAVVLGVPYQQVHKYETGANRLSAGRLYRLAEALGVEVGHFFREDRDGRAVRPTAQRRMLLELVRNFAASPTAGSRRRLPAWPARWPGWARPRPARTARWRPDAGADSGPVGSGVAAGPEPGPSTPGGGGLEPVQASRRLGPRAALQLGLLRRRGLSPAMGLIPCSSRNIGRRGSTPAGPVRRSDRARTRSGRPRAAARGLLFAA